MSKKYKICNKCVMDVSDREMYFDANGTCRYCIEFETNTPLSVTESIDQVVDKISRAKGKYQCVIGVSGGVDSSYVVHLAHKFGLKALLVHFDNGWNSDLAVKNIERLIAKTHFDLETVVVDWNEFKDLQRAFFKAGVVDIELLTDHAIAATVYRLASKYKIPFALTGNNPASEHGMPRTWNWLKADRKNILDIHKQFGEVPLKTFPLIHPLLLRLFKFTRLGPESVDILNYVPFNHEEAINELKTQYGWEPYGEKHGESVFTKFYQAYILPTKFGIDKRRPHYSAKIRNQELSREEALALLDLPLYDETSFKWEKAYVLEKLDFSEQEFEQIMKTPARQHSEFQSDAKLNRFLSRIIK